MIVLAWLFTLVFTMIVGGLYSGNIVQDLWLWFVVPLGLKPIGLAHAMGLSSTISYFLIGVIVALANKKSGDDDATEALARAWGTWFASMVIASMVWGWAAIVHGYM